MRHLRILAPLAVVAALASACGSGSSSQAGGPTSSPTTAGAPSGLELRPVYARYATGVPLGPNDIPQALVDTMSHHQCPAPPSVVSSMLLECDAGKTVYLLKDPIVSGGVVSATPKQIGHKNLWFVQITLDATSQATLDAAAKSMTGTELAYSLGGTVVTSVIIDPSFATRKLAIIGSYNKAQATQLAGEVTGSAG